MTDSEAVTRAKAAIGSLTPLKSDCGRICGGACCLGEDGDGMLLFPGEEAMKGAKVSRCKAGRLLVCNGRCSRDERPLACMMFPLLPVLDGERIRVAVNAAAWRICPLAKAGRHARYDPQFIRAVRHAGRILTANDDCRAMLSLLGDEHRAAASLLPDGETIVSSGRMY